LVRLQFNAEGQVQNEKSSNRKFISPAGHILQSIGTNTTNSKILASSSDQVWLQTGEDSIKSFNSEGECTILRKVSTDDKIKPIISHKSTKRPDISDVDKVLNKVKEGIPKENTKAHTAFTKNIHLMKQAIKELNWDISDLSNEWFKDATHGTNCFGKAADGCLKNGPGIVA
jgi:hypothetical protein